MSMSTNRPLLQSPPAASVTVVVSMPFSNCIDGAIITSSFSGCWTEFRWIFLCFFFFVVRRFLFLSVARLVYGVYRFLTTFLYVFTTSNRFFVDFLDFITSRRFPGHIRISWFLKEGSIFLTLLILNEHWIFSISLDCWTSSIAIVATCQLRNVLYWENA